MNASAESLPETVSGEAVKTKPAKVKKIENDLIVKLVQEISNLSAEDAIKEVPDLLNGADENHFKLGGVLSLISTSKFFKVDGFENFKDFVEGKFGIQYRRAMYWITIYDALVESGVPWEKVQHVGWTKLRDLAPILTLDNVDEWVERAMGLTTIQLQDAILKFKAGALTNAGSEPVETAKSATTTVTFKIHADDKILIKSAIEKAKHEAETEYDGVALVSLCNNYLTGGMVAKPASLIEILQKYTPEEVLEGTEKAFPDLIVSAKMKTGK